MNTIEDRLRDKYVITELGCWEWMANKTHNGYGQIYYNGSQRRAHRVSYEIHIGPIPSGMLICHRCDNPSCINPEHLFIGTVKDNINDCIEKGRFFIARSGNENHRAILTSDHVKEIRERYSEGSISRSSLAKLYGVSKGNIQAIIERRSWRHVA
jgi:hypothetical protein